MGTYFQAIDKKIDELDCRSAKIYSFACLTWTVIRLKYNCKLLCAYRIDILPKTELLIKASCLLS